MKLWVERHGKRQRQIMASGSRKSREIHVEFAQRKGE